MRKSRIISVLLVMVMCCSLLTGCVGEIYNIKVNKDGSGIINVAVGLTEEAFLMMESMGESMSESMEDGAVGVGSDGSGGFTSPSIEEDSSSDMSDLTPFEYNGVTYYGEKASVEFSSIEEFNEFMSDFSSDSESTMDSGVDTGLFELSKNSDGSLNLLFEANEETGDTQELEAQIMSEEDMAEMEEMATIMLENMAIVFEFEFADNIHQIAGNSNGITIDGKKLTINVLDLDVENAITLDTMYFFTTGNPETVKVPVRFSDVARDFWAYPAITAMANGGLVAGIGDGKFNPQGTLTYAQFCQILARAKGLETGELNGYWAGKAIESCIANGYILSRGEITRINYDVSMSREAAVSAMYLARKDVLDEPVKNLVGDNIPDFSQISPEYKENILSAYNYGITNGVDSYGTFNPFSTLTRAQVCQLFYNLDWTSPIV